MNDEVPAFILADLFFWPLRSRALDDLTKRVLVSGSLFYALGVILINAYWLGAQQTLAPARSSAVPGGLTCALSNVVIGLIPFGLLRLSLFLAPRMRWKAWLTHVGFGLLAAAIVAFLVWNGSAWLYEYSVAYYSPEGDWHSSILLSLSVTAAIFVNRLLGGSQTRLRHLSTAVCLSCTVLFVYEYSELFYDSIPQGFGGGRLPEIRLIVKPESMQAMNSAGLKVNEDCLTSVVSLIDDSGSAYTLLGHRTELISKTSAAVVPFFMDIDKGGVEAVVHKPFSWPWQKFEKDQCWSGAVTDRDCDSPSPSPASGKCRVQPAPGTEPPVPTARSTPTPSEAAHATAH
jgi:hypothetical protein